ncbi:hypothetical protein EVAR_79627_1 [Eumeta japonica]|uniref:Uncharacterized protein n=1 Tax=Eumeta variegata TaxID=151549 RepID=A0A4C1UF70_EUMVA|nr:hypothetical protein EVAR_79627_1 [Eumeta japonica]
MLTAAGSEYRPRARAPRPGIPMSQRERRQLLRILYATDARPCGRPLTWKMHEGRRFIISSITKLKHSLCASESTSLPDIANALTITPVNCSQHSLLTPKPHRAGVEGMKSKTFENICVRALLIAKPATDARECSSTGAVKVCHRREIRVITFDSLSFTLGLSREAIFAGPEPVPKRPYRIRALRRLPKLSFELRWRSK